jgi:hypothetical protein
VDPERATKKYFLRWYYYNGVSLRRTDGLPDHGVFYFGVPRWHYRDFLASLAKWLLTIDGHNRFQNKLKTYRNVGYIAESYRLSQERMAINTAAKHA